MNIEKMELKDLDCIKEILFTEFDDFWNYNVFKQEILNENSQYIVAKENNNIVGFAGILIILDKANITNIVTRKTYRNKGIGKLLLKNLIEISKNLNLKSMTLEVNEQNIPAINLYKSFGFENAGLRKKYYNNEQNAIIMTKKL